MSNISWMCGMPLDWSNPSHDEVKARISVELIQQMARDQDWSLTVEEVQAEKERRFQAYLKEQKEMKATCALASNSIEVDDKPLTAAEEAAIDEGLREFVEGKLITGDQAKAELLGDAWETRGKDKRGDECIDDGHDGWGSC